MSKLTPDLLRIILKKNEKTTITISEEEFKNLIETFRLELGNLNGFVYIFDNYAMLFLENANNVSIMIKSKKNITNLKVFNDNKITIFGSRKTKSFFGFFWGEIKLHWLSLLLISLILGPFIIIQDSSDFIKELNTALISAMAILIGVFLVFITFFYLGTSHDTKYFSSGRYYEHFKNDKYIVNISILTVITSLFSIGVNYYKYRVESISYFEYWPMYFYKVIISLKYQEVLSGVLTLVSILLFWISFKAMTDYYFNRINNQISKDIIMKIHKEYFKS